MRAAEFAEFIIEREVVRVRKASNAPKPWTDDIILQSYRFCNIRREHDKETQWIARNWRKPNEHDQDLWFAMMVARMFNWSPTLSVIGYPVQFTTPYVTAMRHLLKRRAASGQKVWTGAYMISTNGHHVAFKHDYVIDKVLKPAWKHREAIRPRKGDTLQSFYDRLVQCEGMGTFMAGQVIADTKYAGVLTRAADWETWCTPGPGSRRGLNRIMGNELRAPWPGTTFQETLKELQQLTNDMIGAVLAGGALHAQDIQNCLCEFDKYERVRLGEGKPRSKYNGAGP